MPDSVRSLLMFAGCGIGAVVVAAVYLPVTGYFGQFAGGVVICAVPVGCWLRFDRPA